MDASLISVVIPVFNERTTVEEVLRRVQAVKVDKEVVIVTPLRRDGISTGRRT